MRSSTWLYQYSSQTKYNYGTCSGSQSKHQGIIQPGSHQKQSRCFPDSHSPLLCNSDFHEKATEYFTRLSREEPVDMSISSDHQLEKNQVEQNCGYLDRYKPHKSGWHGSDFHRSKYVQPQFDLSSKYYITDVDKTYKCEEKVLIMQKRFQKGLATSSITETCDLAIESWTSCHWSDSVHKVTDIVQQELNSYVGTPPTPVITSDSGLSSERQIFNFDWSGEQHLSNLKLTVRSTIGSKKTQDVQPVMLQLSKQKQQSDEEDESKEFNI